MDRPTLEAHALQTLRILAACALSYGLARLGGLVEWYWALITAVVVMQPEFHDTVTASRNRVLGTLVGAAAGFLVLEAARQGYALMPLFCVALVPLAILTALRQAMRLSIITLVVVALIPSSGTPFERPLDRVLGILVGVAASVVISALIRRKA